jgi:hypothetical protein
VLEACHACLQVSMDDREVLGSLKG